MPHLPWSPSLAPPCCVGSTGVFHGETCVVVVSTKWLLCIHRAVVFKTKILHFKVKDSLLKHTNKKGKFERTLIFLFVDKESFYCKIVLGEIQPCFHGGADANFLKNVQVQFIHHGHNLSFLCSERSGNITR